MEKPSILKNVLAEKVLHVSDDGKGVQEAWLIANRINRKNSLSFIYSPIDKKFYMSGGLTFPHNDFFKGLFAMFPVTSHYEIALNMRQEPFVRPYLEETYGTAPALKVESFIDNESYYRQ